MSMLEKQEKKDLHMDNFLDSLEEEDFEESQRESKINAFLVKHRESSNAVAIGQKQMFHL